VPLESRRALAMEVFRNRPFCGLGSMGFCLLLGPIGLFYKMLGTAKLEGAIPCFIRIALKPVFVVKVLLLGYSKLTAVIDSKRVMCLLELLQLILAEEYHHPIFDCDGVSSVY